MGGKWCDAKWILDLSRSVGLIDDSLLHPLPQESPFPLWSFVPHDRQGDHRKLFLSNGRVHTPIWTFWTTDKGSTCRKSNGTPDHKNLPALPIGVLDISGALPLAS